MVRQSLFFCALLVLLLCLCSVAVAFSTRRQKHAQANSYFGKTMPKLDSVTVFNVSLVDESLKAPFPHYWEKSVGACHMATALRADYQQQLRLARDELGIQQVRQHGIFGDDMSVVLSFDEEQKKYHYSFFNIDAVFDFYLSLGIRPLVELGFMPSLLARNTSHRVFYYQAIASPPKSYDLWYDLVNALAIHLVQRYGIEEVAQWRFEVWNEPDLRNGFWYGSKEEYFQLYNASARAVKAVNKRLQVGGPASSGGAWLEDFVAFVEKNNIPCDFVSTHFYPLARDSRDVMLKTFQRDRKRVPTKYPLLYTEYNAGLSDWGGGSTWYHDTSYPAAWLPWNLASTVGLADVASFWAFTDIFEEGGLEATPFRAVYGMMTNIGVRKASWRAFQQLHLAGDTQIKVTQPTDVNGNPLNVVAVLNAPKKELKLFVTNYNGPNSPQRDADAMVQVLAPSLQPQTCNLVLIDKKYGNAYTAWQDMGSPSYPTREQIAALHKASEVGFSTFMPRGKAGVFEFSLTTTPSSLAVITCNI